MITTKKAFYREGKALTTVCFGEDFAKIKALMDGNVYELSMQGQEEGELLFPEQSRWKVTGLEYLGTVPGAWFEFI